LKKSLAVSTCTSFDKVSLQKIDFSIFLKLTGGMEAFHRYSFKCT